MAYRLASSTQTLSAGLLETAPNTPTLHATMNITVSTTNLYTATYTATAGGEAVVGCLIYMTTAGSGVDITITHQEDGGGGFADTLATSTISTNDITAGDLVYFSFAVPHVYTTSTAGKQRFRIVASASSGTMAADSAGTAIHFIAFDDTAGAIGATDDLYVIGKNATGTATLTVDGSPSWGSGTNTVLSNTRQIGNAITIGRGGTLATDTVADVTVTIKGNIIGYSGGYWTTASSVTPLDSARLAQYLFNENGTSCNYGIRYLVGFTPQHFGAPKSSTTLWTTELSSGVGTAASPLVTADAVDWIVGDKIVVYATSNSGSNYNESETKYIITKNSATSYVLSDTAGGAESAFTYAHAAGATVVNVGRNIVIGTTSSTHAFYLLNYNTVADTTIHNWVEHNTVGSSAKSFGGGIFVGTTTNTTGNFNYSTVTNSLYQSFIWSNSKMEETQEGLIAYNSGNLTSIAAGGIYLTGSAKKTFNNYHCVNVDRSILYVAAGVDTITFNDGRFNCVNKDGASVAAGLYITAGTGITWNDCEWNATRYPLALGASQMRFNDCTMGTKGNNNYDVNLVTYAYTVCKFMNCTLGSGTGVFNYLSAAKDSLVTFDTLDTTANNHIWYTNKGSARSTGAGLADTTVRTASTLNVRIDAEDTTDGFVWEYDIITRPSQIVTARGYIYENATFVGAGDASIKVELFLPGSTTADDTQNMTLTTDDDSNDAQFTVSANYSGTVYRYATVRITVKTATSGAYAYIADLENGTNNITNLNTWKEGQPSKIMFEQLGDSQAASDAVWNSLLASYTDAGSAGKIVSDIEVEAKNLPAFFN